MLEARDLWSDDPAPARTRDENYPTLLFSWWCTGFALFFILARLWGRLIRTGKLFREDKIMAFSIVPLLIRMGLVHVVLIFGTNNVQLGGLTALQIYHRSIGSRLVIASRIFFAMFIWVSKYSVSEFLKRLPIWRRTYELGLRVIRGFLIVTFFVVVIASLSECQPFDHYWQVIPDPGPHCRNGYAQLITMGTADIITDLLLIFFPIPIFLRSKMPIKRKISLVLLFSLSFVLIAITATRVVEVIQHLGRQQYRSIWASCEILASAVISNAVILGSFVRDRGVKRNKYRRSNTLDSIERAPTRRSTMNMRLTSDDDLFHAVGMRVPSELQDPTTPVARPAPVAMPLTPLPEKDLMCSGAFSSRHDSRDPIIPDLEPDLDFDLSDQPRPTTNNSCLIDALRDSYAPPPSRPALPPTQTRGISFFDVGGLLAPAPAPSSHPVTVEAPPTILAQDFAVRTPPRRSSRNRLGELGARITSNSSRISLPIVRRRSSQNSAEEEARRGREGSAGAAATRTPVLSPTRERRGSEVSLRDVGGLLG